MANELKFTAVQGGSSLTLKKIGSPAGLVLECSYDNGANWELFVVGHTYTLANIGDSICIRAPEGSPNTQGLAQNEAKYHQFVMTGQIAASGNIMSLYDKDGATTAMTDYGFYYLFRDCASLTTAPELPATTLAFECYCQMFLGSALTSAPELAATTLAGSCYQYMFYNCSSLTLAPVLLATTLAARCYEGIFQNCSSLNYVKTSMTSAQLASGTYTQNWLNSVASTGTYESTDKDFDERQIARGTSSIPEGWTIQLPQPAPYFKELFINGKQVKTLFINSREVKIQATPAYSGLKLTAVQDGSSVTLNQTSSPVGLVLECSYDEGANWELFVVGHTYTLQHAGDSICIRAPEGSPNTQGTAQASNKYHNFVMTGKIAASGNVMSLYNCEGTTTTMTNYGFYRLFQNCTSLTSAPELPATTLAGSCYQYMFYNCSSLTSAPKLPATTLAGNCYTGMFQNCAAFTSTPELPATTLADGCYESMFYGCTSLTSAPELPATTLASRCYRSMFENCASLTSAPELPVTTLKSQCYYGMFVSTNLTTAPELPATTMQSHCYDSMFYRCSSLTSAPELPATTLADYCYSHMFSGCTSLTSAPELPATTLASNCYYGMFTDASRLQYVKTAMTSQQLSSIQYTSDGWLNRVASSGTYESTDPDFEYSIARGVTTVPAGWNIVKPARLKLTSKQAGSTVALNTVGTPDTLHLEMSRDGETWTPFVVNNTYDIGGVDEYILLRAPEGQPNINGTAQSDTRRHNFVMTGSIAASGDIMALYSKDSATTMTAYGFNGLFQNCSALTTALELPATTLADYCYIGMFQGCTSLTAAPKLPATTLANACYAYMFWNCTSLTAAPKLPATALANACYTNMFKNCTSLTSTPELPATTLADGCYDHMFSGCTSLSNVNAAVGSDQLESTKTSNWLNNVASTGTFTYTDNSFDTSIARSATTVPAGWTISPPAYLKVSGSAGAKYDVTVYPYNAPAYVSRDNGQTWNLATSTTVTLASDDDYVLYKGRLTNQSGRANCSIRFSGTQGNGTLSVSGNIMTLVDEIGATTTIPASTYMFAAMFENWNNLVDASGLKLPALELQRDCYAYMFKNCKSLVSVPELPATTLAGSCYESMFYGCTSLTSAPELPATALSTEFTGSCYYQMFYNCSSLNYVKTAMTSQQLSSNLYTGSWVRNVASTGTYESTNPDFNTSIARSYNTVPAGWDIVKPAS